MVLLCCKIIRPVVTPNDATAACCRVFYLFSLRFVCLRGITTDVRKLVEINSRRWNGHKTDGGRVNSG